MDSMATSYNELVCSICLDLLAEKPGEAGIPSKRPRLENEPGPSTSRNDGTPRVVNTTCGHLFHEECIKEALKIKKECPNCQRALWPKSLRRTFLSLTPGQCANCKKIVQETNEKMRKMEGKLARQTEKVEEMQVREELILQEKAKLEKDLENGNSRIASQIQSWNQESQRKDGQLDILQRKLTFAEMERDWERKISEQLRKRLQYAAPQQDAQCMDQHNRQPDVISIPSRDEHAKARTNINYIFDCHDSDYEADDESY